MLFAKGQYLLKASTSKTKHLHVHMYKVNNTAKHWIQEKCNCPMMKQEHESNFVNLYFFTLRQEIPRFLKPDLTSLTGF